MGALPDLDDYIYVQIAAALQSVTQELFVSLLCISANVKDKTQDISLNQRRVESQLMSVREEERPAGGCRTRSENICSAVSFPFKRKTP